MNQSDETITPRLAAGVRLKFDDVRGHWVVLAPERVIVPDETALEILRRCDGIANLSTIIDELAASYDAARAVIAADVHELIRDLAGKGIINR